MKNESRSQEQLSTVANAQEQLALITALVQDSRSALKENGFPYILWGGISSVGTALSYLAGAVGLQGFILPLWLILSCGGGTAMAVYYSRAERPKVRHASQKIYNTLWICIGAGGIGLWLVAILFHTPWELKEGLTVLAMLIGIGYVVTSVITNYKAMLILGILWMVGSGVCLVVTDRWAPAIIGTMAFFFEFIPGLALYARAKKSRTQRGEA